MQAFGWSSLNPRNWLPTALGGYSAAEIKKAKEAESKARQAELIRQRQEAARAQQEALAQKKEEARQKQLAAAREKQAIIDAPRVRHETLSMIQQELRPYRAHIKQHGTLTHNSGGNRRSEVSLLDGGPVAGRHYGVNINRLNPTGEGVTTENAMTSALTHELTHIAVDQKYAANADRRGGGMAYNVPGNDDETAQVVNDTVIARANTVKQAVASDNMIGDELRTYVTNRLNYIAQNPLIECDTVLNELTHYLTLEGVPAKSKTSRAIVDWARERYALRNPG